MSPTTKLFHLVCYLNVSIFITGCLPVSLPRDDARIENKKTFVETLIGEPQDFVLEKLGPPEIMVGDGERRFMIYSDKSNGAAILLMIVVPVVVDPDTADVTTLHCFRLEIDANNFVHDTKIKSTARSASKGCLNQFWNKGQRIALKKLPIPTLD